MKRFFLIFTVLVLPVFLFASGGGQQSAGNQGGYLRFAWWGNVTRDERTLKVNQLFMDKNPGVTIEAEPTEWGSYWTKLNTQAASGSLPDIMQQSVAYIEQYNDRNLLVDLNIPAQKGLIDFSQWTESSLGAGKLNGKLIALILGINAQGMGVDPAVLQQAGVTIDDTSWTWKDYENAAITIYQKTGIQTNPTTAVYQCIENISRQYGAPLYSLDKKSIGFTNNAAVLAQVKELFDMNLRLKAAGALYDPETAFLPGLSMEELGISKGKTWNEFYWSNQHVGVENASHRTLGYYMLPSVKGDKAAPFGTYLQPSCLLSMLTASKNQDLAAKFIDFFVNDIGANRILLAERGIPAPFNVRNDLAALVDPGTKYVFDYITKVTPLTTTIDPPYPASSGETFDLMSSLLLQCLTGRISSDAAVAQLVQGSNAILSR
ncbi:MAG: extracellular solute-binding protein [Treponema sp.]|nr:extracellular solute-binding protein [Treponema sp.]